VCVGRHLRSACAALWGTTMELVIAMGVLVNMRVHYVEVLSCAVSIVRKWDLPTSQEKI
jgi:hypothetical protein